MNYFFAGVASLFISSACFAQDTTSVLPITENPSIVVTGKAFDLLFPKNFYDIMVVNKKTRIGVFGNPDGTFQVQANKNDTLIISAFGYSSKQFTYKDSIYSPLYTINVELKKFAIELKEVIVSPTRDYQEIKKDINDLGTNKREPIQLIDALNSPITALYTAFSKFEKDKRRAIDLENMERKKELLKELFKIYVNADIIALDHDEYDKFLEYCVFPDSFLISSTEYELIMAVKSRYEYFMHLENMQKRRNAIFQDQ